MKIAASVHNVYRRPYIPEATTWGPFAMRHLVCQDCPVLLPRRLPRLLQDTGDVDHGRLFMENVPATCWPWNMALRCYCGL